MKRLSSKLAAILLVAVMAVSLFPLSSLAETADGVGNEDLIVAEQQTTVENEVVADETTVEETTSEETAAEVTTPGVTTGEETVSGEEPAAETPVEETAPVEEPKEEAPVEVAAPVEEPVVIPENSITSQPQDALVAPNKKAVFEIETNGKVASYQWQYSANGGRYWKNLNSASYYKTNNQSSIVVTGYNSWFSSNNGYKYRCIVTFKDKKKSKVTSDVATLYVGGTLSVKSTKSKSASNAEVSVKAPEATFPAGTTLEVADVDSADYIDAINTVLEDTAAAEVTAVDISFKYDGEEVEPANDNKVTVTLKSDAVKEGVKLVHIDDEGIATLVAEEDIVSIKNGEIVFKTDAFSIYAVVEPGQGGDEARVTVNFYGWTFTRDADGNITDMEPSLITSYYVKNADTAEMVEKIVADPGIGNIGNDLLFHGWSVDDHMRPTAEALANLPLPAYLDDPDSYEIVSGTDQYAGADYTPATKVFTIEEVRDYLMENVVGNIKEGDVVNVYAGVFKFFDVTYFGADTTGTPRMDVSLGSDTILLYPTSTKSEYTVSMNFSPHGNQNFKGWIPDEGSKDNISRVIGEYSDEVEELIEQGIYPNSTKIEITGSITFVCEAPVGNWLVYNGNGKGATFNAPQFYLPDETTVPAVNADPTADPPVMERNGYTFINWYEAVGYNEDGTPVTDGDGNVILKDEPFEFGHKLIANTNIYAKWEENTTAPYTIVFWTQNADRTAYVAIGSYKGMEGRVGQPIPFTFVDNTDEDYVSGVGSNGHYTGFTLNHSGTNTLGDLQKTTGYDSAGNPQKETITIPDVTADGNAVLNLYFDRIVYNLKFYMYRQAAGRNQTYDPNGQRSYATVSNAGQNVWNVAGGWTNVGANNVPSIGNAPGSNTPRYTIVREDTAKRAAINSGDYFFGWYFTLSAYYGENIESKWPTYDELKGPNNDGTKAVSFVMMNGTGLKGNAYNGNGYGDGRDTIKGVITVMDDNILGLTNDANGNFLVVRYAGYNDWTYHIYYECIPGVEYDDYVTKTINGVTKNYYWDHDVKSRSSNTYPAQQNPPQFEGYTVAKNANGTEYQDGFGPPGTQQGNITGRTVYLNYYYNRIQNGIKYMDGVYLDGNGNTIQTKASNVIWDTTDPDDGIADRWVTYEAAIPEDLVNYTPPLQAGEEGLVFEGWYLDEGCTVPYEFTTMPVDGIIVHARWRQVQYRVFLHPDAFIETEDEEGNKITERDLTLSWGDESADDESKQQMNFRRSWGDKISLPTGTRKGYEFLGWYLADGTVFSAVTELNDTTVPVDPDDPNYVEYDKETDMTDVMDKFGLIVENGEEYWISNQQRTSDRDPYNSDRSRSWIKNRLDLYGKWSKIIEGADGIIVEFDAVEGQGEFILEDDTHTTIVREPLVYKDNSQAVAEAASSPLPKVDEEGQPVYDTQFLYWVVQTYNAANDEYEDAKDSNGNLIICSPGDSYTVLLDRCKSFIYETIEDPNTGETIVTKADYIMRLRAEYGPLETPKDTYFNWYRNWEETDTPKTAEDDPDHGGLLHTDDKLQINEPRDIYTLTDGRDIPERPGYKFLGWARESEKADADDEVTAYHEVTEDDLYIRWVDEAEKVDPETGNTMTDPETGDPVMVAAHYEAQDKNGNWVPVTQVAADDFTPYQAYYAVWDACYYVYYSGSAKLYAFSLKTKPDFTNTKYLTENDLYAGYSTSFGGYTVTDKDKAKATCSVKGYQIDTTANPTAVYNPDKSYAKGLTKWWKTMSTTKITELKPVRGTVYYVKEVPEKYLTTRIQYVYDWSQDNKISTIYLLTNVDDKNYKSIWFELATDNKKQAALAGSFTFVQRGTDKTVTTMVTDFTDVKRGFVGYADGAFEVGEDGFIAPNTEFTITPYWITPDEVTVYGTGRSFTTGEDGTKDTIAEVVEP